MAGPLILSLCDLTGNWSRPYAEAGYRVHRVDIADGQDVRLLDHIGEPVHGILAAPPCDHFALSGARWWEGKGEQPILDGLALVDACLRAVALYRPAFWALENPVGRLRRWLGPPAMRFQPCQFGDPYNKRTCLWGHFSPPTPLFAPQARRAVAPVLGSMMHTRFSGKQKARRSVTPPGFARAFFEANP
jgi:hypothetical protein